eukprot:TRINITY_DN4540_c0_g1_i1.p1 TRINITY_DN4540_c0_g1~~TRINITY_DN4540_c0_g1_i1.p1  ORF type:complete len:337 (+),score=37.94 TRINITY_DN4540_c0_g1_i1:144-1154(+)
MALVPAGGAVHTNGGLTEDGNDDDPLKLFVSGSKLSRAACIGRWRTDGLDVRILARKGSLDSRSGECLMLESGTMELTLTETGFNVWSVASVDKPDVELYVARISGYGSGVRLLLRPASAHSGASSKTAVLQRVDQIESSGTTNLLRKDTRAPLEPRPRSGSSPLTTSQSQHLALQQTRQAEPRRVSPGLLRSLSCSRDPLCGSGSGRASRSCSRSRSRSRRRNRGRSRSRSAPGRTRRLKGDKGGGKGPDGEEVCTLFVSGLPDDTREGEVREDFEQDGWVVERLVIMRRGKEINAFVRMESLAHAKRALDKILSGRLKICGMKAKAEIARRNTS